MQLSFLQSKEWEDFQKSIGRKTSRIGDVLVIKHDLPFEFNYLYCPRPDFDNKQQETSNPPSLKLRMASKRPYTAEPSGFRQATRDKFLDEVRKIAKKEKSIFLKIDPAENTNLSLVAICPLGKFTGFARRKPSNWLPTCLSLSLQPRETVVLDLQKSENEILSEMREKTRYNIRLAEKRGVNVRNFQFPISNFQKHEFLLILQETAERDGFHTHEPKYYDQLLNIKTKNFSNELFFVEYQGEVLAAAIVNFYGDTATYLHGASGRKNKELMAPHLLHWRIIQEAKKRCFTKYDFWGIDEKKWPGVTRFKLGFGGEVIEYPQSVDIIYRPILYNIYKLARKFR